MTLTYIRPDADDTDGTWTNESDSQTNLFASIDETSFSDTDYIKSGHLPDHDICKIRLSDPSFMVMRPATVHYRFKKRGETTQQINLDVSLLEGSTEIAKWTETDIATSYVDGSQSLTLAQFNSISDFNNLYLQFDASSSWWLAASEVDLWFEDNLYHLSTALSSAHLLLHCDGADASTTFIDATGRHQIVRVNTGGAFEVDTAQTKFGGASLFSDTRAGSNRLALDASTDFVFGTGDFTIDFWFRKTAATDYQGWFFTTGATNPLIQLRYDADDKVKFSDGTTTTSTTTALSNNTWHHIALTRASGTTRIFINGTQEGGNISDSNNYAVLYSDGPNIGGIAAGNVSILGWMDEIRVLKGTAAWTTTFTPPTAPYNVALSGPYAHLSCSRASVGYATTSSGTLTAFANNALRITDLGLLVEDARQNFLLQSADFTTTWTTDTPGVSLSVTANQAVAPDATTTMDQVNDLTGASRHLLFQQVTSGLTAGTRTISVFAKDVDRRYLQLSLLGTGMVYCYADLQTGTITDSGVVAGAGTVFTSATIEAYTNGIYRISLTGNTGTGDTAIYHQIAMSDRSTQAGGSLSGNNPSYTGSNKSLYLWGIQVEEAAFPSSYIATTTGSQTRAGDFITFAGNADTLLTGTINSWVLQAGAFSTVASGKRIFGSVPSSGDVITQSNTQFTWGSKSTATLGSGGFTTASKIGISQDVTGTSWVGNAGTVVTDATQIGSIPNGTLLNVDGDGGPFAYCQRFTLWNSKLADATLQTMTDSAHTINFTTDEAAIDLDFANAAYNAITLPTDFLIISRASVGYAEKLDGTLQLFGNNQLRITDKGLLVEDARENKLLQSQDFNTTWAKSGSLTVTTDNVVAPDGTTTADTITPGSSDSFVSQTGSYTSGVDYTFSVWLKVASGTCSLDLFNATGTFASVTANITTTWQRFTLTWTSSTTNFQVQIGGGSTWPVADGAIQAWGAQLELGTFASSYIATTTGSQTRAADAVDCTASLATVLQALPHSACVDFTLSDSSWATTNSRLIGSSTVGNQAVLYIPTNTQVGTYNGSSTLDATIGSSGTNSAGTKSAAGQSSGARSVVAGGGTVAPDANAGAGMSNACLGRSTSGNPTYGYFRRVTVWTSKLADATLQGFTNP